jgi:Arc/MetJ family transcription regulator
MRTNILIDDELMEAAMQATGVRSKKETVELGLQTLVRLYQQQSIRDFKGKLQWDGDLDEDFRFLTPYAISTALDEYFQQVSQ